MIKLIRKIILNIINSDIRITGNTFIDFNN